METPSPRSVKRDVLVFLRMYAPRQGNLTTEEYLDNPFMNIGFGKHEKDHVRFAYGKKPGITPELVAYACADYASQEGLGSSVSATTLVRGVGSVFKMDEGNLSDCLGEAERAGAYSTQEIKRHDTYGFCKASKRRGRDAVGVACSDAQDQRFRGQAASCRRAWGLDGRWFTIWLIHQKPSQPPQRPSLLVRW